MSHSSISPITNRQELDRIIHAALAEDIGKGDVTSEVLIPKGTQAQLHFIAREPMVLAGLDVAERVFYLVDPTLDWHSPHADGNILQPGSLILTLSGDARTMLTTERTALNLLQRMSGVATLTQKFVSAIDGTGVTILDTRKTMPGLRLLDKYATLCGGAENHRMRLDDRILIKDNHIAIVGSVADTLKLAKTHVNKQKYSKDYVPIPIQLECDTVAQVRDVLALAPQLRPDFLLLDNMSLSDLRQCVHLASGIIPLEASGNVTLETVRDIAQTRVDYISIGRITHSAPAVDIGLDHALEHHSL